MPNLDREQSVITQFLATNLCAGYNMKLKESMIKSEKKIKKKKIHYLSGYTIKN